MTNFSRCPQSSRQILMLTAAIIVLAATHGALARNGGANRMEAASHESGAGNRAYEGMAKSNSDRDHGSGYEYREKGSEKRDHKRSDRDGHCEKYKGKSCGTTATQYPPAPGTGGTNTIHPIISPAPAGTNSGMPARLPARPVTENLAPGTAGTNTIHPIVGPAAPTGGLVTVSNGGSKVQIPNGPGGVAVYSTSPGMITVTNGTTSETLPGGSVTLSGNVIGVAGGNNVQVGARNQEGNTVVAIAPDAPPPPRPQNNDAFGDHTFGGIFKGVEDFGYGLTHGFAPGPAPGPTTSTVTQQ
jgi:hypothetical protein